MVLLPTGAGETRRLERNGIEFNGDDNWFPDGKRVVFTGRAPGRPARTYAQNIDGGAPVPVTPEGITGTLVSPDGKLLLANDANGKRVVFPLETGAPQEIRGLKDDDQVLRWADDGRSIYIYTGSQMPVKIYRLNYSTGKREFLRDITPSDPAGIRSPPRVFITPDGKSYVYQFQRYLCELYLIDGLAQR
jgi:Tol biopolymer transport system component